MGLRRRVRRMGTHGLPDTITHEQFVLPEDFPRFRELGVVSALQLLWAEASPDTIEILKPYLDPEIYKWQYPARSILDSGGIISGASDWPVFQRERVLGDLSGGDAERIGRSAGCFAGHAAGGDVLCVHAEFGAGNEYGIRLELSRRGSARIWCCWIATF